MYSKELLAIKRANRFREIKFYGDDTIDLASNDYLGLGSNKKQLKKAYKLIKNFKTFSPKASLLVNGYHPLHKEFEEKIAKVNGFESGLVVGSGFLANIALIEALVRRSDELFIDSEYHASGVLASKLIDNVTIFSHNDAQNLIEKLAKSSAKRKVIAIEGVYSMSGNLANREIFEIAKREGAILIVDEAHSSGTIGKNLLGIFDYYNIKIEPNFIKMGTLGKAYGSYGAYILSSSEIKEYLINRAKPIIYSTAPSVFDIALAFVNFKYILKHKKSLNKKLKQRKELAKKILKIETKSLILPIEQKSNKVTIDTQKRLLKQRILVGAIRQPTVKRPIIRLILRLGVKKRELKIAMRLLRG